MDTKRVLLVTFYYQPDLSAGSFRTAAMVEALLAHQSPRVSVDVLTTQPHRYHSFTTPAPEREVHERLTIRRISLPSHQSGMIDQGKAFAHFAREAARMSGDHTYDLVLATSGRLMTAALGAWIATRRSAPLYLDIRDIFVENLQFLLPKPLELALRPLFSGVERWMINRAVHVNLVSRGFESYFRARYPKQSLSFFTNGVDDEFCAPQAEPERRPRDANAPIHVMYAGNLGEAQGLHLLIPPLAKRLGGRATFTLIGDGGRRRQLEQALTHEAVDNVKIVLPMSRDELIEQYQTADVLFLHLNDYDSFKKVLPSKVFEYAALGKPIWAGVSGYCAKFIEEEVPNAVVFEPCNVEDALTAFAQLQIGDAPRAAFVKAYSRGAIMSALAADALAHLAPATAS